MDDSQYRSEIRLRLEAENRALQSRYLDLEFTAAEIEAQNELLSKDSSPKKSAKQDDASAKLKEINSLKKQLLLLKQQSRDSKLLKEQYERVLKNKQNNIEFLKSEISEIKLHTPSETLDQLKETLSQLKVEVDQNNSMLEVLQKEESDNQSRLDELRRNLNITGEIKPLPKDWKEEPIPRGQLMDTRADYDELRTAYEEANSILNEMRRDPTYGTGDADGLAMALYAEINLANNSEDRALSALYEEEISLTARLEKELEDIRKATSEIKNFREECYERQKKHYDIAVSQEWLNILHSELEKLGE
ncbi:hypothetical protein TVAG_094620 [Trichomonas vaginalis G3]|uniref:Uncharacterized protein n=1 Tax=Trichomonas vaginalis (strain ATCC PRA-98 / G3) TaxID=412133 RepID=A2DBT4_TRIV3|nr:hypothetical protein TVAGG3_0380570 [Trichomonas vaginalis G3]EAY22287.1 hypothetical protein TVAG_094620 [Trichomonas vaginalis G3]KAI5533242.1 hypothetical protein TVAGG3_0380570 [Trichomonas vaginalis G3]|eukprot:XP_001583273.1 hypothetical protein [Trichomonas vaginalis G3]